MKKLLTLIAIATATGLCAETRIRGITADGQPLAQGKQGAYEIICKTDADWNNSGCPQNIKIENGIARLKTEAEKAAEIEAQNVANALAQNKFTKLQIRRAFRALEQEASLDALLASNATFKSDWADAIEIDLSDEMTAQAIAASGVDVNAIKLAIYNASKK